MKTQPLRTPLAPTVTLALLALVAIAKPYWADPASDPRDDASPWAMGSSAEWANQYPKFNPLLDQAGVKWLRLFPGWFTIETQPGVFDWTGTDAILADAKQNHLHILGTWVFFPKWASADGGYRRGPIKDMQFWRDYVTASVTHCQKDIKYWEVWNEFNGGGFYQGVNKTKEYADLMVAAYDAATKVDPTIKVGMSCANFDVNFFDAAIKAGAANHFDFICVHPYENLGTLADNPDGEINYLSMSATLRKMLADNNQPTDTPLWITEMGTQTSTQPDPVKDAKQAETMAKGYLLSIAQGFQRVFWFEARGPSYGHGTDFGLIREDWTTRPAYATYKTMTTLLGPEPKYLGWLNIDNGGYGFMFRGAKGNVLAAWANATGGQKVKFDSDVHVIGLTGTDTPLPAGQDLALGHAPVFITKAPDALATEAQANSGKLFPWGGDYTNATSVSLKFGTNVDQGLKQTGGDPFAIANGLTDSWASTLLNGKISGMHMFRANSSFLASNAKTLDITLVARSADPVKPSTVKIYFYESATGYKPPADAFWKVPPGDQWQEHTWHVTDANFVGQWGYNIALETRDGTPCLLKELRVSKPASP